MFKPILRKELNTEREYKIVHLTNLQFCNYESKYVAVHLYSLDLYYKASSYVALVGLLLDQSHKKVKVKMDAQLCTIQFLNFYIVKSNNICKDRVINFLAHAPRNCNTKRRCFYICSESNNAKIIDVKVQVTWLINQTIEMTEKQL